MSHVIAVPFVPDLGGHLLAEKRCTYKLAMLESATELEGTRMFIYLRFRHCRVGVIVRDVLYRVATCFAFTY
jgi:hypothetical protein